MNYLYFSDTLRSFPGLVTETKNESNTVRASESISINTQRNETLLVNLQFDVTKQNTIRGPKDVPATACHLQLTWAHFISDQNDNERETKYGVITTLKHPVIFTSHYCLMLNKYKTMEDAKKGKGKT